MFCFYDVIEIIYRWSGIEIDTRCMQMRIKNV